MPRSKVKPYNNDDDAEVLDNPEWTEEDFAQARPFPEVFPELAKRLRRARRQKPAKELVSLKLDAGRNRPVSVRRSQLAGTHQRSAAEAVGL